MFKKDSKYRLPFLIFMVLVHVLLSIMNFMEYNEDKRGMSLTGGIVFGLMAIFWADDFYQSYKNKKSINSNGV